LSEFDPISAAAERLAGLQQIHKLVFHRSREAERVFGEAEANHNDLLKMEAFIREMVDTAHANLAKLKADAETEKEHKA
jgi:t-SNARE complex subunit (syntaxin)